MVITLKLLFKKENEWRMNMDRCVCCGTIVPEGTQVCWNCLNNMFSTSHHKDPIYSTIEYIFEEKEIKHV